MPAGSSRSSRYVKMMLAMGLVFEMPTAGVLPGAVRPGHRRLPDPAVQVRVLIIFIAAAILTPGTDVVSQAMMAGPMIVLYILSIGIAWLFGEEETASSR